MTDAGFFKGTSAEQDARFADKKKKLMKTMKFGENLSQKVDMTRINLESIRPWIVKRITELLNFEDELVCDYLFNQLEERHPDPKEIQINMTGFLNSKNARIFLSELWDLLLSAMETPDGVPAVFLEAKKEEILKRQEEERLVQSELLRKDEKSIVKTPAPAVTPQAGTNVASDTHGVSTSKKARRRSSTSSSPSPRPRRRIPSKSPDKNTSHPPETQDRQPQETETNAAPLTEETEPSTASKIHRSPSRDQVELPPTKRTPESDWRRDLMQGRRRSPPEMPENSYYGYDKRSKERRHSRERDRERERRRERASPDSRHHRSHRRSSSRDAHRRHEYRRHMDSHHISVLDPNMDPRYRHHMSSRLPEPEMSDRRRSHKHEDRYRSRSRSSGRHERAVKSRHSHWTRNEDEIAMRHGPEYGRMSHRNNHNEDESSRRHTYNRNQSPEGPLLPPSHVSKHSRNKLLEDVPRKRPKRQQSTSSESSESSSSSGSSHSSSDGSSSSSSSSGEESSCSENAPENTPEKVVTKKPTEHMPEGPSLPPELEVPDEPEGPSLPPALNQNSANQSDGASSSASSSSSSGSSTESEDEQSGGSSSSGSGSSSSSSSSESEEDTKQKHHNMKKPAKHMKNGGDNRVPTPEGPALPPSNSHRHKHSKHRASTEEALRQRALASLMRGSGKRRTSSRSP